MELEERSINGYGLRCPRCAKGVMSLQREHPIWFKLGRSKVVYECTECEYKIEEERDTRFL
jgi:hypothetical protein